MRPALELALEVARAGRELSPSLPAPRAVERVLGFTKLPPAAWEGVRRAVDADDAFRARVAFLADEEDLGRAGWLWLRRPDGWEQELAALVESSEAEQPDVAGVERRARREAEREARRRQRALEEERDRLRAELAAADRARRSAEAELAAARQEAERLQAERRAAVRRATEAERRLAAKGAEAKDLAREVTRLREDARQTARRAGPRGDRRAGPAPESGAAIGSGEAVVHREVPSTAGRGARPVGPGDRDPSPDPTRPGGPSGPSGAAAPHDALGADRSATGDAAAGAGGPEATGRPSGPWAGVDPREAAERVTAAARAAGELAAALADLAGVLGAEGGAPSPGVRDDASAADLAGQEATARPVGADPGRRSGRSQRRRPLRLPGGLDEGSSEAAAWLVRHPRVAVVIDGYNVSRTAWDDRPIAEQRVRLLDALGELEARTGADLHVVFDGADPEARSVLRRHGRRGVRLTFSPDGTEADDVVLDLVAGEPAERPVVVVTSDGAVRAAAAELGANVVSSRQLLDVLRR